MAVRCAAPCDQTLQSHFPAAEAGLSVDDAPGDGGSIISEQQGDHPATSSEVFQRPRGIVASSGRSISQPGRARQAPQFYATGLTNAIDLAFGPGGTPHLLEIAHNSFLGPALSSMAGRFAKRSISRRTSGAIQRYVTAY